MYQSQNLEDHLWVHIISSHLSLSFGLHQFPPVKAHILHWETNKQTKKIKPLMPFFAIFNIFQFSKPFKILFHLIFTISLWEAESRVERRQVLSCRFLRCRIWHSGVHVTCPGWDSPQAEEFKVLDFSFRTVFWVISSYCLFFAFLFFIFW